VHTDPVSFAEVLVVEDEQFTRTMLNVTLQALGFGVAGLCSSAEEALGAVKAAPVGVALLDLDLGPGPSGVDIAHALREVSPNIGIVLLTTFTDPRLHDPHERTLPKGSRYLVKTQLDDPEVLRSVIIDAYKNPLKDSVRVREGLALTSLQLEVLRLVAMGMSNTEIAMAQGVTDKAVERTVQRITEALGMSEQSGNKRVLLSRAYTDLTGKSLPS
jgi:two-component system, NarL family, invasion response regulator UvrY